MKNRINQLILLVLISLLILGGCSQSDKLDTEGKLSVVTSFYPLYDFAQRIGGEHVHVMNLVTAGVEPHEWQPKPQDVVRLTEAEVFIYNGLGFEGWVDGIIKGLDHREKRVIIEASQGITPIRADEVHDEHDEHGTDEAHASDDHDHHHGEFDPHVWLSPLQAITMAQNIKEGLIEADEAHASDYEAGFAALKSDLEELHADYIKVAEAANRKDIVVSHQAYAYLARDYGLKQVAVMGLSPEAEPTAKDLQRVFDYVKEHRVKYVLFEELASPQLANVLAKDAGIESLVFHPLEGLTEDQTKAGENYVSLMRKNLEILKIALQ